MPETNTDTPEIKVVPSSAPFMSCCGCGPRATIVKVGGAVVEDPAGLETMLDAFAHIRGPKILVHGGGRSATTLAQRLGVPVTMVAGRRITDADTLDIAVMVYAGKVNKGIVAALHGRGIQAIGLCGADAGIIRAHRRGITADGTDYGYVGDVDAVDSKMLLRILQAGLTPVIAPLTHDGSGTLLNTNADTIASSVATAIASIGIETTLTYVFEKPGVLSDADNDASTIRSITADTFETLKADGTIGGGMIPKIQNAIDAVRHGVRRVRITDIAGMADNSRGTTITA